MQAGLNHGPKAVSFIDLGSNSVRMMVIKVLPNGGHILLNQVKHMVQLGQGAFQDNYLQKDAMERTMQVLLSLAQNCKSHNVTDIVAVATAATRDAVNGQEFLDEVHKQTGILFNCISGEEEARLIYRGVSESFEKNSMLRLYLDIGGGSTEFVVGDSYTHRVLDSVKLGCVRLANMFPPNKAGRVSEKQYQEMQSYVRDVAKHTFGRMAAYNLQEMVASSGTAQNLALISAFMEFGDKKPADVENVLTYKNLVKTIKHLRALSEDERKNVMGINPKRIDLIIPGAVILQTVMEELGLDYLRTSTGGLRDGLLRDYIEKNCASGVDETASVQERSVLKLARACRFEEVHARHVAKLALRLFDSSKICNLHSMEKVDRDMLYFSSLLHDVGVFISFSKHDKHGQYLITHHPLLGFNAREIELMASLVGSHRLKGGKDNFIFPETDPTQKANVEKLAVFLKLAEALDKCHGRYVDDATIIDEKGQIKLILIYNNPCPLEMEKMEQGKKILKKLSPKEIQIEWKQSL